MTDLPVAMVIAGARPNFMKVKPIIGACQDSGAFSPMLVHTGQHYDDALSEVFFDELGMAPPDYRLEVGSGSHAVQTSAVMTALEPLIDEVRPEILIVVGDVNSTLAAALVAAKAAIPVAHVEAGLRSHDWAMPEEVNRLVTDRLSDLLLAPSPDAVDNLLAEGYFADQIHLVGNVMVDTLLSNVDRARAETNKLKELGLEADRFCLATLHRPSNVDDPQVLAGLVSALKTVSKNRPVILPAHPRSAGELRRLFQGSNVRVTEPFGYLDFIAMQSLASLVLTDSGGIQEETTVLGTPCLTLRESTERPITVDEGTNTVVGTQPNVIVKTALERLEYGVERRAPALWDGNAGGRVVEAIRSYFDGPRLRPTDHRDRVDP